LTIVELAPHYQLVVDRTQEFPRLAVHVEPAEGVVAAWGGFVAGRAQVVALAARVGERLRGHLGLNPEIAIVPPKSIPRSEGKAVRVVERR
jgi:phenylacetate-CoA ligase